MITRWIAALGLGALFVPLACSSDDKPAGTGGAAGTTFGIGGAAGNISTTGGAGPGGAGPGGASGVSGAGGGVTSCSPGTGSCNGVSYAGENLPLDIYIMFDQSCSMSCPVERGGTGQCCMGDPDGRIFPIREAVADFLNDPASAGIGIGIGYFGYMQAGNTSCQPPDYANPAVPIATNNAQQIINSVNGAQPTGETPTGAAIRGACTYASQWKSQNPSHVVVVLLVTDGVPEAPSSGPECVPSIDDAEQAARQCAERPNGLPSLPVYVLGVGQALQNLNRIAQAGGTNQAYLVDSGNVSQQVLQALNAIRQDAAIPCQLRVPVPAPGQPPVDLDKVNVAYCGAGQPAQNFFFVNAEADCTQQNTWYYNADRSQILLCPSACNTVSRPGGELLVSVGCTQITPPVQ
jgi:hypothetical protein